MLGARRHRFMAGTIVVLLSGFGAGIGHAQEGKLLATCSAPQLAPADTSAGGAGSTGASNATANVTCEVRGSGPMTFKSAKVAVKAAAMRSRPASSASIRPSGRWRPCSSCKSPIPIAAATWC